MIDRPLLHCGAVTKDRFLEGLAIRADVDRDLLDRPGTTVVGREDRAGTGIVVCYWAGNHALVWVDPELRDRVGSLTNPGATRPLDEVIAALTADGFTHAATADMRVLPTTPLRPPRTPRGYLHRWLSMDESDVALVRAFAQRSDPDEVDEAGLEDMDNFDETAINVLTSVEDRTGETLLAYASACDWEWDPLFADIGVLVDPAHRTGGLGRFVVAHTTKQLVAQGRIPLYRHGWDNLGSKNIAASLGFEPATTLAFFTSATDN